MNSKTNQRRQDQNRYKKEHGRSYEWTLNYSKTQEKKA